MWFFPSKNTAGSMARCPGSLTLVKHTFSHKLVGNDQNKLMNNSDALLVLITEKTPKCGLSAGDWNQNEMKTWFQDEGVLNANDTPERVQLCIKQA